MRNTLIASLLFVISTSLVAQEMPKPPKQLQQIKAMVGDWTGKGTVNTPVGKVPWTSKSSVRWALNGFAISEHLLIEFGEGVPMTPLAFISYTMWDSHLERFIRYEVGSTGELGATEIFLDGNKMSSMATKVHEGEPMIESWVTTVTDDTMTMTSLMGAPGTALQEHVVGTFSRGQFDEPVNCTGTAPFMGAPVPEEMKRLGRSAGTYDIAGYYLMGPEGPKMEFTGVEKFTPVFGGLAMEGTSKGEGWESYSLIVWNARDKCYETFGLNSMGHGQKSQARWYNDKQWGLCHDMMQGPMYTMMRFVADVDDNGKFTKGIAHCLTDGQAPYVGFEATYKLK